RHRNRLAVVARDHSAESHAAEGVHVQHHRVEDHAADVLEVAVDAVRAGVLQRGDQRLRVAVQLVVDAGVEAEFLYHVASLGCAASTTAYSCQPPMPTTLSPGLKFGWRDSTTSPTVPPIITASSGCGCA